MKKILLSVLIAAICTISADCKSVKGSVKDARGKGISGVVVSDGLNTAVTKGGGRFKLEVNDDSRFVFISTPSGYVSKTLKGAECFFKELKGFLFIFTNTITGIISIAQSGKHFGILVSNHSHKN